MKCNIDNKSPRSASHLKSKAKKSALIEERYKQIETENRILLGKMSNIMKVSHLQVFELKGARVLYLIFYL